MEYYTAIRRKEVLIHAIIWMNLANIMLGKTAIHKKTRVV